MEKTKNFQENKKIITAEIFFEDSGFPFIRTKIALDRYNENVGTIVKDGRRVICLDSKWIILKSVEKGELKI